MPHESAALHVTGRALYTDDLAPRTKDVLHAWPVQVSDAHAQITALRVDAAYDEPGVVRVLTADDVPGVNDCRRSSTTSRCSRPRSCTTAMPSAGCSARRSRQPVGGAAGSRSSTSRSPRC